MAIPFPRCGAYPKHSFYILHATLWHIVFLKNHAFDSLIPSIDPFFETGVTTIPRLNYILSSKSPLSITAYTPSKHLVGSSKYTSHYKLKPPRVAESTITNNKIPETKCKTKFSWILQKVEFMTATKRGRYSKHTLPFNPENQFNPEREICRSAKRHYKRLTIKLHQEELFLNCNLGTTKSCLASRQIEAPEPQPCWSRPTNLIQWWYHSQSIASKKPWGKLTLALISGVLRLYPTTFGGQSYLISQPCRFGKSQVRSNRGLYQPCTI